MSHFNFWPFPPIFWPIITDLSGNIVWSQIEQFWWTFVYSKFKRSSLRSQCWMRLFLWFSNTVIICYQECPSINRLCFGKASLKAKLSLEWITVSIASFFTTKSKVDIRDSEIFKEFKEDRDKWLYTTNCIAPSIWTLFFSIDFLSKQVTLLRKNFTHTL